MSHSPCCPRGAGSESSRQISCRGRADPVPSRAHVPALRAAARRPGLAACDARRRAAEPPQRPDPRHLAARSRQRVGAPLRQRDRLLRRPGGPADVSCAARPYRHHLAFRSDHRRRRHAREAGSGRAARTRGESPPPRSALRADPDQTRADETASRRGPRALPGSAGARSGAGRTPQRAGHRVPGDPRTVHPPWQRRPGPRSVDLSLGLRRRDRLGRARPDARVFRYRVRPDGPADRERRATDLQHGQDGVRLPGAGRGAHRRDL